MSDRFNSPGLGEMLEGYYRTALENGLPTFPLGVRASTPMNAAPYVIGEQRFREDFGIGHKRASLLDQLGLLLEDIRREHLKPVFLLTGGSFADRDTPEPKDLDGALFYTAAGPPAAGALKEIQRRGLENGIDVRLMPFDAQPVLVAKAIGFFSLLYTQRRKPRPLPAILIVDLAPIPSLAES